MPRDLTALVTTTEAAARVLAKYQIDPAEFFVGLGLDPAPYADPDARLDLATIVRLWSELTRQTRNPEIGFEIGMAVSATNLHAVGYACLASRTVREVLERLVRYHRMLSTAARWRIIDSVLTTELHLEFDERWPREPIDGTFAGVIELVREVSYVDFAPRAIEMRRPRPDTHAALRRHFGCPIEYGAGDDRILFHTEQIEKFLPRQNPALALAGDEVATQYISRMDRADVLTKARIALIDALPDGEPTRTALAERLHMSDRTLSRRLSEHETSFRELLDDVRHELAIGYVRQPHVTIMEITYLLGFSDQSNFARSFRRWTDQSPTGYRTNQTAQPMQ